MKVRNLHKVPKPKWRRWSPLARYVFNELYSTMKQSPWAFSHPKTDKISPRRWDTTAWNASWIAADAVVGGTEEL